MYEIHNGISNTEKVKRSYYAAVTQVSFTLINKAHHEEKYLNDKLRKP